VEKTEQKARKPNSQLLREAREARLASLRLDLVLFRNVARNSWHPATDAALDAVDQLADDPASIMLVSQAKCALALLRAVFESAVVLVRRSEKRFLLNSAADVLEALERLSEIESFLRSTGISLDKADLGMLADLREKSRQHHEESKHLRKLADEADRQTETCAYATEELLDFFSIVGR